MLGKKTLRALCQPNSSSRSGSSTAAPAAAAGEDAQQAPAATPEAAEAAAAGPSSPGSPPVSRPRGLAGFPRLVELDLSCSCSGIGGGIELQLDGMQAAMPLLRVLKLSGLGGFYGELLRFWHAEQ